MHFDIFLLSNLIIFIFLFFTNSSCHIFYCLVLMHIYNNYCTWKCLYSILPLYILSNTLNRINVSKLNFKKLSCIRKLYIQYCFHYGSYKCIFFVRKREFFLTLDTIDILCLVYSNFCANKILFKVRKRLFMDNE